MASLAVVRGYIIIVTFYTSAVSCQLAVIYQGIILSGTETAISETSGVTKIKTSAAKWMTISACLIDWFFKLILGTKSLAKSIFCTDWALSLAIFFFANSFDHVRNIINAHCFLVDSHLAEYIVSI